MEYAPSSKPWPYSWQFHGVINLLITIFLKTKKPSEIVNGGFDRPQGNGIKNDPVEPGKKG